MQAAKVKSPDGREWTVRVRRFRMPAWHHSKYDPWDDVDDLFSFFFALLVVAPLMWVFFPLVWALVQVPFAAFRSLVSHTRWVEAVCGFPAPLKLIWKTRRDSATEVAKQIAARLAQGYEGLAPAGGELVFMTQPPELDDTRR